MKRVKIMLLSLTLLAIVGGALAFKARFHVDFCTTTAYVAANNQSTTCTLLTTNRTTTNALNVATVYTTPAPNQDCTYFDQVEGVDKGITCQTWTSTKAD